MHCIKTFCEIILLGVQHLGHQVTIHNRMSHTPVLVTRNTTTNWLSNVGLPEEEEVSLFLCLWCIDKKTLYDLLGLIVYKLTKCLDLSYSNIVFVFTSVYCEVSLPFSFTIALSVFCCFMKLSK